THQRAPQGTNPGEYSEDVKAALAAAIAEAQEAYNHQQITKEIVDNAHKTLSNALNTFGTSANQEPIEILDKTTLSQAIADAIEELEKSINNVGLQQGNYPQEAVDALGYAITQAQTIRTTATTQSELTSACNYVQSAVETYRNAHIMYNNQLLVELLSNVDAQLATATLYAPCAGDGYSTEEHAALSAMFNSAKGNYAHSQAEINSIYNSLLPQYTRFLASWTEDMCIDIEPTAALGVYPTVATSHVTINSDKTIRSISVISLQGEVLVVGKPNATKAVIDVSTLAKGTYVVRIVCEGSKKPKKQTILKL
ncbi:MAG: T9SS type A sorting domain-containing protein, partial [Bacteroidales bacterium]|nr:T9SS type A sorting domain-containing protein [Bacteroidales bacterium]